MNINPQDHQEANTMDNTNAVQAAEAVLRDARQALEQSRVLLATRHDEIETISEQIRCTDADDEKTLARLATRRATLQAQTEALTARVEEREGAVHDAERALTEARAVVEQEKVDAVVSRIEMLERTYEVAVEDFADRIAALADDVEVAFDEAHALRVSVATYAVNDLRAVGVGIYGESFRHVGAITESIVEKTASALTERLKQKKAS